MNLNEEAAKKRAHRALDKLRKFFEKKGLTLSTGAIATCVAANSLHAAPSGLTHSVAAVAIAKGSVASASTLTLVNSTMKLITWLKIKTALTVGAAVILAGGTTLVATKVMAQLANGSAAIDDSSWAQMDSRSLAKLPPAFILRPTHFAAGGGMVKAGNKMLGRAISFDMLMSLAYGIDLSLVVSPADKPTANYDLLVTAPEAAGERLQAEIKRQLGFVGHRATRQTAVWLLTLKQADAPGLRPSRSADGGGGATGSAAFNGGATKRTLTLRNASLPALVRNLQGYFDKPILDRTGLTAKYDITLEINANRGASESDAVRRALSAQLGLELVPSQEAVETFVVTKAP